MVDEKFLSKKLASVSVIIPCFQSANVVKRAIESVIAQTWQPLEVIVVDDCSTDNTLELLNEMAEEFGESWLKVVSLDKNSGPATARNAGWDIAKGDYIAFLDADDSWHPRKLEIQYRWMQMHPALVITGHPFVYQKDDTESIQQSTDSEISFFPVSKPMLLRKNYFPTPTMMIKRDLRFRFREGKNHSEEYLLACELCCEGYPCAFSKFPFTYVFKNAFGDGGLSENIWKMEKGELGVYKHLYSKNKINLAECFVFSSFSFLKFIRRSCIVFSRRLFSER